MVILSSMGMTTLMSKTWMTKRPEETSEAHMAAGLMKNIASSAIIFPKWKDLASKGLLEEILCLSTQESAGSSL